MEDLYRLCLEALPNIPISDIKGTAIHKKVAYFFKALKSIRDSWSMSHKCLAKYGLDKFSNMNSTNVEQLAAELFDKLEDEELNEDYTQQPGKSTESHPCNKSTSLAAENYARTAVSPDISNSPPRPPPRPPPPGVQVCQKSSILPQSKEEVKAVNTGVIESRLQKSNGTEDVTGETGIPKSAPPPPVMPPRGSKPTATPVKKGFGPPPPPPIGGKSLLQRKAVSKLKRSTQMPSLFQILKEKMEGSNLTIKSSSVRTKQLGGSSGGREGMSATLAELSKRSTYFLQIQEDIQKYAKSIFELKAAINSFQTNDMVKLLKFRNHFESILGVLTDESQVLAKFEDFPTQKLETLRAAAALYSKLETIVATLKNWEIVPPLSKLLDKVECYIRKERREAKTNGNGKTGATEGKMKDSGRLLWRVFRLAFQAYSFAGGQDDHSTKLANELANEILVNSQ
uniref:Hydroxyproline-rich glycoprotein family protein n=1 Tax=Manihot esculenta TaxID=3983 RepID=A0A2C9W906_MANES